MMGFNPEKETYYVVASCSVRSELGAFVTALAYDLHTFVVAFFNSATSAWVYSPLPPICRHWSLSLRGMCRNTRRW